MVELRADYLDPSELSLLTSFPRRAGLPAILTVRRRRDGGLWDGAEAERSTLLARSVTGGFAFVDLEEDLEDPGLDRAVKRAGVRVIRSFHDFSGAPQGLGERLRRLPRGPGEIPKAAVMPKSSEQLIRLAEALLQPGRGEKILVGMGEAALFSRVLAAKMGCFLTYCSIVSDTAAAPGHLDPRTLVELYRFRRQNADTFVCGVIGDPIAHSRSPELHNRGYERLGLNGVYLPFLVDDVPAFFRLADLLEVRGFSVTMPHKRTVLPLLHDRDPAIERIGACNTVVRRNQRWWGTNTDVQGFLSPLERTVPQLLVPTTKATVIGAGGGARSVVHALCSRGIHPLIVNRSVAGARALADLFDCSWAELGAAAVPRIRRHADLIVQATGAGMEPDSQADPLPQYGFSGSEVVYDLVYQPLLTVFRRRAQEAGCRTISGLDMLYAQGASQFEYFTGRKYPMELLDEIK